MKKDVKKSDEYKQGTRFIVILAVIGFLMILLVGYVVYLEMYGKYSYMKDTESSTLERNVLGGKIVSAEGEPLYWKKWEGSASQSTQTTQEYNEAFFALTESVRVDMAEEFTGVNELFENEYKVRGETVRLTIRADLQRKAHEIFERRNPNKLGAVVALDPKTGEILCAYTHRIEIDGVLTERNVAFESSYAPGSTMKVLWAGVALDENKVIDEHKPFAQDNYYSVKNLSGEKVRINIPHTINLEQAIQYSVNTYFAQLTVEEFNEPLMRAYADKLYIGRTLDLAGYGRMQATLTTGEDGIAHLQNWGIGHEMLVSPLHMAMLAAAVANDGNVMEPYLVSESVRYNGKVSLSSNPKRAGKLFSKSTAQKLRNYMDSVVNASGGTAYGTATSSRTRIAGKTGTANNNDAWFIGFASKENPEIAVAVYVEGGGGGGAVAAPIAKELIEYYLTSEGKK